ncbi:MAG: VCBS repeat-containing protein, partial [bacterium]|nr:VCBS repeat-containing protein [bacterium]
DGTFIEQQNIPGLDNFSYTLASGDWNNDGYPDLAMTSLVTDTITLFTGGGDGTFAVTGSIPVDTRDIQAIDFDGDGNVDLITAEGIYYGAGDGTFPNNRALPDLIDPRAFITADFNHDNLPDLAISDYYYDSLYIITSLQAGGLQIPPTYNINFDCVILPSSDFNNDGHSDLALFDSGNDRIVFYDGVGDGTFTVGNTLDVGAGSVRGITGDWDEDGRMDLAVSRGPLGSTRIALYLNNGDGTFTPGDQLTPDGDNHYLYVVCGHFTGDGHLDLLCQQVNISVGVVFSTVVHPGNGDGTFGAALPATVMDSYGPIYIADLDGDELDDLLYMIASTDTLSVYLNRGDGTFSWTENQIVGDEPGDLAFGDFNSDGNQDTAVAHNRDYNIRILLGGGDGTFTAGETLEDPPDPPFNSMYSNKIISGDFDQDGDMDLAATFRVHDRLTIYRGMGDGTFDTMASSCPGNFPSDMIAADFNEDGDLDLAVWNALDDTIVILIGNQD